jgi:hypothetical protein
MLISLLFVALAFGFLLQQTDNLRIRLLQYSKPVMFNIDDNLPTKKVNYEVQDDDDITAVYEPHHKQNTEMLFLPDKSYLTKFHEEFKDSKYKPERYSDYKISNQVIKIANHSIQIRSDLPELWDKLHEINKVQTDKVKASSIKTATNLKLIEQVRIGSHTEVDNNPILKHPIKRLVEDYETVYHDNLVGKEWLKKHANDLKDYEPTIEIFIDDKSLSLNGNYKPKMITEFMGGFTHKERAGKKGFVPVMNGEHLENVGGGLYFSCKDGEHLN